MPIHMMKAGALALALMPLPVLGQSLASTDSVAISVAGLDLSKAADRQRLEIRLAHAADAVCGRNVAQIHLAMETKAAQCRADTIRDARAALAARTPGGVQQAGMEKGATGGQ